MSAHVLARAKPFRGLRAHSYSWIQKPTAILTIKVHEAYVPTLTQKAMVTSLFAKPGHA